MSSVCCLSPQLHLERKKTRVFFSLFQLHYNVVPFLRGIPRFDENSTVMGDVAELMASTRRVLYSLLCPYT